MNLNVVVAIIVAILSATGIDTSNINVNDIASKVVTEEQSDVSNTDAEYQNNEDDSNYNNREDSHEENAEIYAEPTLDEKYNHNQNREDQSENEEDVWYDVPECTEHDFTITEYSDGDGCGIEYICKKCGYSYTEPITEEQFMESLNNE